MVEINKWWKRICNNVAITSNGVVYATLSNDGSSSGRGVGRSDDGMNWTKINDAMFPPIYARIANGINPLNENEIYFLAAETMDMVNTLMFLEERLGHHFGNMNM